MQPLQMGISMCGGITTLMQLFQTYKLQLQGVMTVVLIPGAKPESWFAATCKVAAGKDLGTDILVIKCISACYSNVPRWSACVLMCMIHVACSPPTGDIFKGLEPLMPLL